MEIKWEHNGEAYVGLTTARVYEIRLTGQHSPRCELRVRDRAVLVGVPTAEQWRRVDEYKNPVTAMAFAQYEEDN